MTKSINCDQITSILVNIGEQTENSRKNPKIETSEKEREVVSTLIKDFFENGVQHVIFLTLDKLWKEDLLCSKCVGIYEKTQEIYKNNVLEFTEKCNKFEQKK